MASSILATMLTFLGWKLLIKLSNNISNLFLGHLAWAPLHVFKLNFKTTRVLQQRFSRVLHSSYDTYKISVKKFNCSIHLIEVDRDKI